MTFEDYQRQSSKTAIYPKVGGHSFVYPALGLASEAGEVAGKFKKIIRDDAGKLDEAKKQEICQELGDVLWYIAQLATELDLNLDEVAAANLEKLFSRMERDQLRGSGDNR